MKTANIIYQGVEMEVHFIHNPAIRRTLHEEGNPDFIEIEEIFVGKVNIIALLDAHIDEIEKIIML